MTDDAFEPFTGGELARLAAGYHRHDCGHWRKRRAKPDQEGAGRAG